MTMDFVVGLPQIFGGYNNIWVIIDWLTKSAHLISSCSTFSAKQLARIYIQEIDRLHQVPISIVSDQGS